MQIIFHPVGIGILFAILGVAALLLGSALVSGAEVAYFSLGPTDRNMLETSTSGSSRLVMKLLEAPERLLATILITNNFINISIIILSSYIMNAVVEIPQPQWMEFLVQVVILTFLLLLFGEIMPKLYANRHAVGFSQFMSYPLLACKRFFHPLSSVMIQSTSMVKKRLARKGQQISMDELSEAIDLTAGDIADEKDLLEGIIKFGNIDVSDVMKPRTDVTAIEIGTRLKELIGVINESGYSRIPIFDETFDNIKGLLYIKDLLPHLNKGDKFKWQSLIRPPFYVPENKKIDDLLHEFQTKKMHMAVVIDEYGGTSGIVTLEDILEEIVGDISDESDEDEIQFRRIDDRTFIFDGKIPLNDFYKITGTPSDLFDPVKGDADTLAGLILEIKGEFPAPGTSIDYEKLRFYIDSVDKRRIRQIRLKIMGKWDADGKGPGGEQPRQ